MYSQILLGTNAKARVDMDQNTIAVLISGGALVVAFLSFWIAWKAHDRDRNDLRFTLTFHCKSERGTAFAMRLVNHGRRLIILNLARLHFKTGEIIDHDRVAQVWMREAEDDLLWFPMGHPSKRKKINPMKLKKAEVTNTLGKIYKYPNWSPKSWIQFIKLKREITKAMTEESIK